LFNCFFLFFLFFFFPPPPLFPLSYCDAVIQVQRRECFVIRLGKMEGCSRRFGGGAFFPPFPLFFFIFFPPRSITTSAGEAAKWERPFPLFSFFSFFCLFFLRIKPFHALKRCRTILSKIKGLEERKIYHRPLLLISPPFFFSLPASATPAKLGKEYKHENPARFFFAFFFSFSFFGYHSRQNADGIGHPFS